MRPNWTRTISLVSRGARYHIRIAAILMTVLPILVVCFIALTTSYPPGTYSFATKVLVSTLAFAFAASGYAILRKYPKNIMKLRQYLRKIAEGELPDKITLLNSEDDIKAIENYLNTVLVELRSKMQRLENQLRLSHEMQNVMESQQKDLLQAERHRVMIQSLGAACHHIGQPTTVLRAHLHLLKKQASSPKEVEEIEECGRAVDSIAEILEKLKHVSQFRTVSYLGDKTIGDDKEILDIEDDLPKREQQQV